MSTPSLYIVECICGARINSMAQHTRCAACGRECVIEWPARYVTRPDRNGTLPALEVR